MDAPEDLEDAEVALINAVADASLAVRGGGALAATPPPRRHRHRHHASGAPRPPLPAIRGKSRMRLWHAALLLEVNHIESQSQGPRQKPPVRPEAFKQTSVLPYHPTAPPSPPLKRGLPFERRLRPPSPLTLDLEHVSPLRGGSRASPFKFVKMEMESEL